MKTELKHVLANLKEYTQWDIKNYPLSKEEAEELIEALDKKALEEEEDKT